MTILIESEAAKLRERMVAEQIAARGISDPNVLDSMQTIPRHCFVPPKLAAEAYNDNPLPIGNDQTISQPYIVASMTEELHLTPKSRVLEIGTGSGYQTAVLANICREVCTVEIDPELQSASKLVLDHLGFKNIEYRLGDGSRGWLEKAPFDRIIVTAASESLPECLINQLADGGRMVIPLCCGDAAIQQLYLITRHKDTTERKRLYGVRFVLMRHKQ